MPAETEQQIAEALEAWVLETLPELVGHYDYATSTKALGLPDVVIEIEAAGIRAIDARFPWVQLQQRYLFVVEPIISLMIDNRDPEVAAHTLRDFTRRLREQALADPTLGRRVFITSPEIDVDFVPQFVQYDDGTRGRQAIVRIPVATPVEAAS